MKLQKHWISAKIKFPMILIVPLVLVGCLSAWQSTPKEKEEWVNVSTFVDGILEVKASVPPTKQQMRTPASQLIVSKTNEPVTIFSQGYNTGRGKYSGMNFIHINAVIIRIENDNVDGRSIDFDDIKRDVYLARPDITGNYQIVGLEKIRYDEWLRVNLIGKSTRRGVSYIRPIYGHYALLILFSMFGEHSDETKLYQERYEDLKKVVQSVQVTVEDFELERAKQQ